MSDGDLAQEAYDIAAINDALNEFGMLSSITESRKQYLRENEKLLGKLQHLNMNGEMAGPSQSGGVDIHFQKSFFFTRDGKSKGNDKVNSLGSKEKENKTFDCFRIPTVYSHFISSFKLGYSFPLHDQSDKPVRRVFKNITLKRKFWSHPYEKTWPRVVKHSDTKSKDTLSELDQTACRLRTTSLSSGTCGKRCVAIKQYKNVENITSGLQRSHSMENLTAAKDDPLITLCDKTKDLDTVLKGIQEMQVEDCT